jgi:hypothetical protein
MRTHWLKIITVLSILVVLWVGRFVYDYFDPNSPANLATVQLKMFGAAMYEYHSHTGRWPTSVNDLAQTSLPAQSRVWRQTANTIVFRRPQNLKIEPKENGHVLIAYWNGGLFNKFRRVWICWGDLRTERIKRSELREPTNN